MLVDISVLGARVELHVPLSAGAFTRLTFTWEQEEIAIECRIVRSRLERFSAGTDAITVYHAGLEFETMSADTKSRLKDMIGRYISRALDEQKLNARGMMPYHDADRMPIFRFGGQLSVDAKDKEIAASAMLPIARVMKESGYICYALENNRWRRKRTHDPNQPDEGFTISAMEEHTQAELLCDAYVRSDNDGRRMIQLLAQLSIVDGEGGSVMATGRFEP